MVPNEMVAAKKAPDKMVPDKIVPDKMFPNEMAPNVNSDKMVPGSPLTLWAL